MRMSKQLLALVFCLSSFTTPALAVDVPAEFSFHGSGYGHGVGLSQMGARSMALVGQSSSQILQYFYKDVIIEPLDDSKILRINIGHLLSSTKITSSTNGAVIQLYLGDIGNQVDAIPVAVFSNKASLNFTVLGANVVPSIKIGKNLSTITEGRNFTIRWSGTRYLAGTDSIISVTQLGSTKKYRYGQIQVKAVKDLTVGYRLELTNSVRLADEYLWGVSEMPSFWPTAALQAQAIASRTYALSKAGIFRSACDCTMYSEISDQKFIGYAKELELKYGVNWKSAVTDTAGLAITQTGVPITAYFFSSSGGKTELALNAWGSAKAFTQIVDDPGSLDVTLNPRYAVWDRVITQAKIAAAFLLPDVETLEILARNASGTVGQIRATSNSGIHSILTGEVFRSRTKIPSAYFDLVTVKN